CSTSSHPRHEQHVELCGYSLLPLVEQRSALASVFFLRHSTPMPLSRAPLLDASPERSLGSLSGYSFPTKGERARKPTNCHVSPPIAMGGLQVASQWRNRNSFELISAQCTSSHDLRLSGAAALATCSSNGLASLS